MGGGIKERSPSRVCSLAGEDLGEILHNTKQCKAKVKIKIIQVPVKIYEPTF